MEVTLYSTGCPQCKVLRQKLDKAEIDYELVTDTQTMIDKGFVSAPMLEVDGNVYTFSEANKWVTTQIRGGQ